jgi:hypothetical protein
MKGDLEAFVRGLEKKNTGEAKGSTSTETASEEKKDDEMALD